MDASFQAAVLDGIGVSAVSDDSIRGFAPQSGYGEAPAADQNVVAQGLGDPMDLDFDFDAISWAGDLDPSASRLEPELDLNSYCPPMTGLPSDILFAEDEGVLPTVPFHGHQPDTTSNMQLLQVSDPVLQSQAFTVTQPSIASSDSRSLEDGAHDHDLARERLRRQLSLLSKGWCGDEIRFKNCDPSKAVILHNLAMELGLSYNHDVRSREVSMCRLEPVESASRPQPAPGRLSSSIPRSSTELDSTLCIPALPVFPALPVPEEDIPFTSSTDPQPAQPTQVAKEQSLSRHPSRSERISASISQHVSTLKTSISKGGRRGPLSENGRRDMRALEGAGGACWRCKVLRRKCDPGSPCRCCLQSVPTPLGEDAPLWPLIGCRRGPLRDSIPVQLLCPQSQPPQNLGPGTALALAQRCRSAGVADRCLLSAESQRLADMKTVLEGSSYKLSITDETLRDSFSAFIEAGRYRDRDSLHTSYALDGETVTYTELIAIIAWELAENQALLPLLEIRSWENFMGMLETACIYESEVGQTSLVMLSMVCLRHCLEALRLHSANLLSPGAHEDCGGSQCQVECVRNLSLRVAAYIDELSSVIFNKENMRDRRWWLSTFYSLYIQSYVRHALITIEKQLRFRSVDDVPAEDLTAYQYLHLPAVLFTAASAKYDPLLGGRLQYALTDNSVIPETSVPELHHSSARVACEVDKWPDAGIRTSYQFLRKLLQIGSLDFESGSDSVGARSPLYLSTSSSARGKVSSPISPSLVGHEGVRSPRSFMNHGNRDSWGSRDSAPAPTIFSNKSSDSLARSMSTDMTSLYEPSVFAGVSFSGSVADLDAEMGLGIGTINPTALYAGSQTFPPQPAPASFDPATSGSSVKSEKTAVMGELPRSTPAFVCNCCPRTPRHFHTSEELAQHESEKPHPCTQCKKRFKSPTEAERHINAIHLKSDSWSCNALEDALVAFQSESFNGVVWDVCGFCGGGFARKDGGDGDDVADDAHQAELVSHLESVHKIGECDRNKKFYRADNFRQHLKKTHVAKPGKWLKVLEGVCRTTGAAAKGGG
ncbi:Fez family zinc finger protein 2 [Madurella mycetomatis]|uniref:Fez family zinc finger protein 2 n=1 Tax=Madurella mycetomatis TaxID=100816 RepID=A0A175VWB7_9PEZI|nr:Fez family zinc finger protein 2 [Madurella mycetomatis]